jgi:hypothetical protein
MSESSHSPLARLILFMFCLSIAGSLLAGTHYTVIDRPQQEFASHPPLNGYGTCYEVDWWTALWSQIFHTRSCGVCYDSYNCCCD